MALFAVLSSVTAMFPNSFVAQLSEAGSLSALLGSQNLEIDSLTVIGPIDETDFATMFNASFYGELAVIDISRAIAKGGVVPGNAFFHEEEQSKINSDGSTSFIHLKLESMILPKELIAIEKNAFRMTCLKEIEFPETLQEIGDMAFSGSTLISIDIPSSCPAPSGKQQFYECQYLRSVTLPDSWEYIPIGFAANCELLVEVTLPVSLEFYDFLDKFYSLDAFSGCESLENVEIPEGCRVFSQYSFNNCPAFKKLELPSTMEIILGNQVEYLPAYSAIISRAENPPVFQYYVNGVSTKANGNFREMTTDPYISQDIPIYIPIGTHELYRSMPGWDWFTNFIETDFDSGIDSVNEYENGLEVGINIGRHSISVIPFLHEGVEYTISTISGIIVASGHTSEAVRISVDAGEYIVKAGSKTAKFSIKK